MVDYIEYMGYDVKVKDKDGYILEGELVSYSHGYDRDPEVEHDFIAIRPKGEKGFCIELPIPDIESFEVLED